MTIRVVLADDHRLLREGLRALLEESADDVKVVGQADDGRSALALVKQVSPDVVVMDIGMPGLNGVEATRQVLAEAPRVKVIALSTYSDRRYVLAMLEAGASGYVVKSSVSGELLRAIRAVSRHQKYLSPEVADAVVASYVGRVFPNEGSCFSVLGRREREVVQLLAEGSTSKEIAHLLHISVRTVEAHRRNIMQKLDIHSVAELTKYAVKEGLSFLEP
jgi:DNA-binding NarL/FixJ family response regulator